MYRIYIVDDEPSYQKILKDVLEKAGFEVQSSVRGQQALFDIETTQPDVILLDIMLPGGINGFDILEQLKSGVKTKNIPVIVFTNLDSQEKVAKEIGAAYYFIKSDTKITTIVEKVKELVSKNST